jgi:hypothetical protein
MLSSASLRSPCGVWKGGSTTPSRSTFSAGECCEGHACIGCVQFALALWNVRESAVFAPAKLHPVKALANPATVSSPYVGTALPAASRTCVPSRFSRARPTEKSCSTSRA